MTRAEMREALIEIIRGILANENITEIKDDVPLDNQVNLDSMDYLDLFLAIKKKYRIDVPEADYDNFKTMKGALDYLESKLKEM